MALTAAQIEQLKTIRANLLNHLETESANPKPTYTVGNKSVDWGTYYEQKLKEIEKLDEMIAAQEDDAVWEVRSVGYS